jgi:hypothetical protein
MVDHTNRSQSPLHNPKTAQPHTDRETGGKQAIDVGLDPLALLTETPEKVSQLQRMIGNRATTQLVGRGTPSAPSGHAIIQRVKSQVPQMGSTVISDIRAFITLLRQQAAEYVGYPPVISQVDEINPSTEINTFENTLNIVVNGMNLNDDSQISSAGIQGHFENNAHWRTLANAGKRARSSINARFEAWTEWCQFNPDRLEDLDQTVPAGELGINDDGAVFGSHETSGLIYKVYPNGIPSAADNDEQKRYYSYRGKRQKIEELRGEITSQSENGGLPTQIPMDWSLRTHPSHGAKRMREILAGGGDLVCNRVMSASEMEKTRASGGQMIAKLAASKWFTIGAPANINSSGDVAHSHPVEWKIRAAFRNVLMMPNMNCYNENEDSASDYKEPYWVWKEVEVGNIALSPVVTAIFNDHLIETKIDGEMV